MTKQIGDRLIVDGETVSMPNVLRLPEEVESISSVPPEYRSSLSACWRGYVATWAIEDGKLFLKQMDGVGGQPPSRQLMSEGALFASWYTGPLRIPRGAKIVDRLAKHRDLFEQEEIIEVANGLVVARAMISNNPQ